MADLLLEGDAAVRATEALLRATGGRSVLLRMAVAVAAGDEAAQMGVGPAAFQDTELGPCVFRRAGRRLELLVSAAAVRNVVRALEFDSANVLFATAAGVVVDAEVYRIEKMTPLERMGAAMCYRLQLIPSVVPGV